MAKKAKTKSSAKKPTTAVKVRKAAPAAKRGAKYDQPGAPWWK
jgi:hypothetical protein